MAGAQSSQHRLSPAISTSFFFPNTGLKYVLSNKSYILNAAVNISMPKAVTDQQTPNVEGGSEETGTGDTLMMLRGEYKERPQLL